MTVGDPGFWVCVAVYVLLTCVAVYGFASEVRRILENRRCRKVIALAELRETRRKRCDAHLQREAARLGWFAEQAQEIAALPEIVGTLDDF
jgi:hypothetical protein